MGCCHGCGTPYLSFQTSVFVLVDWIICIGPSECETNVKPEIVLAFVGIKCVIKVQLNSLVRNNAFTADLFPTLHAFQPLRRFLASPKIRLGFPFGF